MLKVSNSWSLLSQTQISQKEVVMAYVTCVTCVTFEHINRKLYIHNLLTYKVMLKLSSSKSLIFQTHISQKGVELGQVLMFQQP